MFVNEIIGGCVNTQRPEIINYQPLAIKILLHEIYATMPLTIATWLT